MKQNIIISWSKGFDRLNKEIILFFLNDE